MEEENSGLRVLSLQALFTYFPHCYSHSKPLCIFALDFNLIAAVGEDYQN